MEHHHKLLNFWIIAAIFYHQTTLVSDQRSETPDPLFFQTPSMIVELRKATATQFQRLVTPRRGSIFDQEERLFPAQVPPAAPSKPKKSKAYSDECLGLVACMLDLRRKCPDLILARRGAVVAAEGQDGPAYSTSFHLPTITIVSPSQAYLSVPQTSRTVFEDKALPPLSSAGR